MSNGPRPVKNIIIDIVLGGNDFPPAKSSEPAQPSASPDTITAGQGVKEASVCRPALQAARRQASLINTMPATSRITPPSLCYSDADQTAPSRRRWSPRYRSRPTAHRQPRDRSFNRLRQGAERAQYCRQGQNAVDLAAEAVGKLQKTLAIISSTMAIASRAAWIHSNCCMGHLLLGRRFFWVPDLIKTIPITKVVKPAIFSRDRLSSNSSTLNRVISKIPILPTTHRPHRGQSFNRKGKKNI